MNTVKLNREQRASVNALANGIIPADEADAGAAAAGAGPALVQRIENGIHARIYLEGVDLASRMARDLFGKTLSELAPCEMHEVVGALRIEAPPFFKQLRMDVAALYLSDPAVWKRIGFPGPSIATGGYPDFDQRQS